MSRFGGDRLLSASLSAAGGFAALLLVFIVAFVAAEALPLFAAVEPAALVSDSGWQPAASHFNLTAMIAGSLAVSLLALALAGPLGLAAAIFQAFYAPPGLRGAFRRMVELLAGLPSVVYGLWGLTVIVPLIAELRPPGTSLLAAALVLSLMILPTAALFAGAALEAVPAEQRKTAAALGLTRWRMIAGVILPAARSGIATGLFLALARALGETMAVMMVAGNVAAMPDSLLEPVRTLTANIALEMAYALDAHRAALFFSGLLVMAMTLGLVLIAERLKGREVHL